MSDQRQVVEQAVEKFSEINGDTNYRFKTIHFNKIASEFGKKPQEVINDNIDYDVYIGLMGGVFGSPTEKYGSGTEEEFNIALEKYRADSDIYISFLFMDVIKPINEMNKGDIDQYLKVKSFKESIGDEGLYQPFSDNDNLTDKTYQILRRVLSKYSQSDDQEQYQMEMLTSVPSKQVFIIDKNFYSTFLNYIGADLSNKNKANILLSDIYVPLELSAIDDKENDEVIVLDERISSNQLTSYTNQTETKIFISGEEHSGKTTFCKKAYIDFHSKGIFPVYIKGSNIKNASLDNILKYIEKQFIDQYNSDALKAYKEIDRQKKLLIIDDFTDSSLKYKHKLELLNKLEEHFSHIIVTADEFFVLNAKLSCADVFSKLTNFKSFQLRELGYSLRDQFTKKWLSAGVSEQNNDDEINEKAEKYRSIMDGIIGTNFVPKKPLVILVLLQAIEGGSSSQLAYSSYVRYYRYLIDTTLLSNVRYDKSDIYYALLPNIAYAAFSNGKQLSKDDMKRLIHDFCEKKGVDEEQLNDVKSNLISLEVLNFNDDMYSFKHNYTYYYFLGQYLSDNLLDNGVRDEVIEMCEKLHVRENSNIIIFLSYHSHDPIIIDSLCKVADNLFKDTSIFKFKSDNTSAINTLVYDSPKIIIEHEKEKSVRNDTLKQKDEFEKNNDEIDDANDILDLGAQINLAHRTIEIIGQLLKNHYVSFDAEPKKDLYIKSVELGLRCLNFIIDHISGDVDDLVDLIRENNKFIETEKEAKKAVFSLASILIFSFIKNITQFTGADSLSKTYEDVLKEKNTLVYDVVGLSTKLDFFEGFPMVDLKGLANSCNDNHLAMTTIRNLVKYRLYMRPISDYKTKDQICSTVGIEYKKQHMIQLKSSN